MIALGCDHGGYELKLRSENIWMRKELSTKIMDATALLP